MDYCNHEVVEICSFVLSHPKWKKAFSYPATKQDVINHVLHHYKRGTVVIAHHESGEIGGVLLYTPRESEGMLSVDVILSNIKGIMKAAVMVWQELYPTCVVYAERKGKTKTYNPNRFFSNSVLNN